MQFPTRARLSLITCHCTKPREIREQISLFSLSKTDLSVHLLKALRERNTVLQYILNQTSCN